MSDDDPTHGPENPQAGGETQETEAAEGAGLKPAAAEEPVALADAIEPPPLDGAAEAFHRRARLAEDRLTEVLDAYRKLKAESEGHRERVERNIERRYNQRRERLLLKFIDILDNLDRALEAAERTTAGEPLIDGLILVRTQLLRTLKGEGLERIPVMGLPFDPSVSETVGTETVDDSDQHHVVVKDVMRGYRLHGRVARHARVVIGHFPGMSELEGEKPAVPEVAAATEAAATNTEDEASIEDIVSRLDANDSSENDEDDGGDQSE